MECERIPHVSSPIEGGNSSDQVLRRDRQATEPQLRALRKWRVPDDAIAGITRGTASDILTAKTAASYEPATEKQIAALRRDGFEVEDSISKREAGRMLRQTLLDFLR